MAESIRIRELDKHDNSKVATLSKQLADDGVPCSFWGLSQDDVQTLLEAPNKITLVAVSSSEVVGIGTVTRVEFYQSHLAELSVAVCPKHRRLGIARSIVQGLEEVSISKEIELLKALIWTENIPSRRLFEQLGYEHRSILYAEFKSAEFGEIDDCVYYKRI